MHSPYAQVSANLIENGYHPLPVRPGAKVPGDYTHGYWANMPAWTKFCETAPASFLVDEWEGWPDAGVCIAHGNVVGLDVDTDRKDVAEAILKAVTPSPTKRLGAKGYMGYYRPGAGLDDYAGRVRWYDGELVVCEVLLRGTQSVLPPTIHPKTKKPYRWITPETLEDTALDELPELTGDDIKNIDTELNMLGLTRKAPRQIKDTSERPASTTGPEHDLEVSVWRSLNNRALEPEAIDKWWPALELTKSRQRGPGAWEAVPRWRESSSGRLLNDRNPNLKAVPSGIVDFGADRSYTPVDVVMAARDCSEIAAKEWLEQYVRPEEIEAVDVTVGGRSVFEADPPVDHEPAAPSPAILNQWPTTPVFHETKSFRKIRPITVPTRAEFNVLIPKDDQPFPIQNPGSTCTGLLGNLATYLSEASTTSTEAGGLAVALPMLGAIMGRAYATMSGLRTNIYSVVLGGSGTGKTSLVSPAQEIMRLAKVDHLLGAERIMSGSGLLTMLLSQPCRICFLDEFGHMLQQIGMAGSGIHAKQILTEFTQLYSSAGRTYRGAAYATRDPEPIDCPHLCLFGMATPDQFWRAFGSSSLEDGSIARYLLFPLNYAGPKEPDFSFQDEVVEWICDITEAIDSRRRGNLGNPELCIAQASDQAETARRGLVQKMDACAECADKNNIKGASPILRRVAENATKIALISAVANDPREPKITERDFDIGHAIAHWSACQMIKNVGVYVADNQHERDVNEVEAYIKAAGKEGRPKYQLQRKFRRIKKREMTEIIEGLQAEDTIYTKVIETGKRPLTIVYHNG